MVATMAAAPIGAPAAGTFTKAGYTNGDWNYTHGTPVMATVYGLDVVAPKRWGKSTRPSFYLARMKAKMSAKSLYTLVRLAMYSFRQDAGFRLLH